jgi:methionyl-tRNA formyltransferase
MKIRIIYFGTSRFAVQPLLALADQPDLFEVAAVVTRPDQPAGRGHKLSACPVAETARACGLLVFTPVSLKDDALVRELEGLGADAFVVAAYGKILPAAMLALPRLGCLNLHGSILPKFRGASPIQAAIAANEAETGVSLMRMDEEMDHGPVYDVACVTVGPDDTFLTLEEKLSAAATNLLVHDLPHVAAGKIAPREQDHAAATYTKLITREDGLADWASDGATTLERRRRAHEPWPGLFTYWSRGGFSLRLTVRKAAALAEEPVTPPGTVFLTSDGYPAIVTASGALKLTELQLEGKNPQDGKTFLNGYPDLIGARLGKTAT